MSYLIENLRSKTLRDISNEFARIDPAETALDFFCNELHRLPAGKLRAILALIPSHISHLSLARTNLNLCTTSYLAADLAFIPAHIKSLDLSDNQLFAKSVKGLRRIFRALPTTIQTLDLSCNAIVRTMREIIQILSFINKSVIRLKLRYCALAKCDDLILLVANIPPQITSFDMSNNYFYLNATRDLLAIFSSLSDQVEELTLSSEDVEWRSMSDLIQLGRALRYITKLPILDGHGNPVGNLSKVAILKSYMGSAVVEQYKKIEELSQLSPELRRLVLEYSNVKAIANLKGFLDEQAALHALHSTAWRNCLVMTSVGGFAFMMAPFWWPCVPLVAATTTSAVATSSFCTGSIGLFTSSASSLKKPEPNDVRRLAK